MERLLRAERDALAPVKIAVSSLRILVKADLVPFLGGEITIERIAFPEFPQRNLGAEPDDSVAAGAAMAPSTEISQHSTGRLQLLRHHGCKRPSADRAADTAGCRPHERHVKMCIRDRMYGFNDKGEVCPRISLITFVAIPDSSKLDARLCRNKRTPF